MKLQDLTIKDLQFAEYNPRNITKEEFAGLKASLKKYGQVENIIVNKDMTIISGHQRSRAWEALGNKTIMGYVLDLSKHEEKKLNVLMNSQAISGTYDNLKLLELLEEQKLDDDYAELRFDMLEFDMLELEPLDSSEDEPKRLADIFLIPPFSIFDTTKSEWLDRKKEWIKLGIRSEKGRDVAVYSGMHSIPNSYREKEKLERILKRKLTPAELMHEFVARNKESALGITERGSTSVFDPVLTEVCYKWFTPKQGSKIIDPFAGGSVRGIVASKLGYQYYGCDLNKEQIEENKKQGAEICQSNIPNWVSDDSLNIKKHFGKVGNFDLVFSCPPYVDLEIYSDKKEDLSNMNYKDFITVYSQIIKNTCDLLEDNRFAVFVVGEVRNKQGCYYNFVDDTKKAFEQSGCSFYNEIILKNAIGSGAMRANRQFSAYRKVVKIHQNVLVFFKGDPKTIKTQFEPPFFDEIIEGEETKTGRGDIYD